MIWNNWTQSQNKHLFEKMRTLYYYHSYRVLVDEWNILVLHKNVVLWAFLGKYSKQIAHFVQLCFINKSDFHAWLNKTAPYSFAYISTGKKVEFMYFSIIELLGKNTAILRSKCDVCYVFCVHFKLIQTENHTLFPLWMKLDTIHHKHALILLLTVRF